jgi:uncharacterized cupin superfamily protein
MQIKKLEEVAQAPVTMEGAAGCRVRWLVGDQDAAPNFAMREFELDPGGHTPRHFHPYEHEIYVLEGEGATRSGRCDPATSCTSRPTTCTSFATPAAADSACCASSPTPPRARR